MFKDLTKSQQRFIKLFVAGISMLYLALAVFSAISISQDHAFFAASSITTNNDANAKTTNTSSEEPILVNTGIYLDSIENVSIKDSYWTATFYVWFRWQGDKSIDPGKSFQLVDARIDKKELQDSFSSPDGMNYQCYKISAKMTNFFHTRLLPLESHTLTISIEDAAADNSKLKYVIDNASNISGDLQVPGFNVLNYSQNAGVHTYKTTYGDPRIKDGDYSSYSQYNFSVVVKRIGFGFYLKLFIGMFAGVLLTLGTFFIRAADTGPRYGIPSAAYFGAIGNTYLVNSLMPPSGYFGLTDWVTGIGLLTITLCVGATLISGYQYLRKDEKQFSLAIDSASWRVIGFSYIAINIMLPLIAYR